MRFCKTHHCALDLKRRSHISNDAFAVHLANDSWRSRHPHAQPPTAGAAVTHACANQHVVGVPRAGGGTSVEMTALSVCIQPSAAGAAAARMLSTRRLVPPPLQTCHCAWFSELVSPDAAGGTSVVPVLAAPPVVGVPVASSNLGPSWSFSTRRTCRRSPFLLATCSMMSMSM